MKKTTTLQRIIEDLEAAAIGELCSYTIPSLFAIPRHIDIVKGDVYYDIRTNDGYPIRVSYEQHREFLANEISDIQEIGKYVIGNVVDDTNRVFINRISKYYSIPNRDGWWDMFSLSENTPSIGKGRYVFSISRFTEDKDQHPIAILKEVIPIDMSDESAICMAINSRKFIRTYKDYLSTLMVAFKNYQAVSNIDIFEDIVNGEFDEKKFLELLNSKTPDEIDIDMLIEVGHDIMHPLYAKINRMEFRRSVLLEYVYRIRERYKTLNLGNEDTTIVAKAMAVEKYYNDLHKAAKEKKKAERKAKKNKK